jgi:hypothetical protein
LNAEKQLKTELSTLSKTQEADQKLLEDINKIISDATDVISMYNCNKQFVAECFINSVVLLSVNLYFPYLVCLILTGSFWMTHSAILTITVLDPKNATQPNLNQSNRI